MSDNEELQRHWEAIHEKFNEDYADAIKDIAAYFKEHEVTGEMCEIILSRLHENMIVSGFITLLTNQELTTFAESLKRIYQKLNGTIAGAIQYKQLYELIEKMMEKKDT